MRRRNNFLIAALVAAATYATLSAFIPRPYGWHRGWRHHHYYDDQHHDHRDRYNDGNDARRKSDQDRKKSTDTTTIY